jgi:hypothetical protein
VKEDRLLLAHEVESGRQALVTDLFVESKTYLALRPFLIGKTNLQNVLHGS